MLRPIAFMGALANLFTQMSVTMLPVLFVRELRLPVGILGLYLAGGGVGIFVGACVAAPVGRWLGLGRTPMILGAALSPVALLPAFIDRGPWLWIAASAWLLMMVKVGIDNVILVSFRQRVTPDRLLGRMNATMRFLLYGGMAVGSGLAALFAQVAGVHTVLWIGAVGMGLAWLPIFFSPLRHDR